MFVENEIIDFLKTQLFLPNLANFLSFDVIDSFKKRNPRKYRERLYSLEIILQVYLYQAVQDDKSDTNALKYIHQYYKTLQERIKEEELLLSKESLIDRKRGRPRLHFVSTQKSKLKEISFFPSSINEAKQRFPLELMEDVFKSIEIPQYNNSTWHNHKVYIVDGTTFVTPDTKELREYFMPDGVNAHASLPVVKFLGIIDHQTGMMLDFAIDNYKSSESKMLKSIYNCTETNSILMGDDLYSSFSHLYYAMYQNKHMIAQGKHKRNDELIKELGINDAIVEWTLAKKPVWFSQEEYKQKKLQVRRIRYQNPRNPNLITTIYTTLLDHIKYPSGDIIALYASRWDIETGFRELKKIMKLEHLRTNSVQMVKKEIYSHIIAYNILKKINASVFNNRNTDFPPLREELQNNYRIYKDKFYNLDKIGRSYIRKSPGRYPGSNQENYEKEKRK
jgi:hypothetical protein